MGAMAMVWRSTLNRLVEARLAVQVGPSRLGFS
jgi:hypothetical protein